MSHQDDWEDMRACVRLTREIFAQPAFTPYRGEELQPGGYVTTDAEIDAFLRDKVESAYHPCGTCRMGRVDDPMAVVDEDTRVIGIDGLRVVDFDHAIDYDRQPKRADDHDWREGIGSHP